MRSETLCQQVACSHPMVQIHMKDVFAHVGISHIYHSAPPQDAIWGRKHRAARQQAPLARPESSSLFTTNIQLITASCD